MTPGVQRGHVGIRPPGALGVAIYYHLTRKLAEPEAVHFLLRPGAASARAIEAGGGLWIETRQGPRHVNAEDVCLPGLTACWNAAVLPEIVLACANPDQLLGILDETVAVIEHAHYARRLSGEDLPVPIVILCSNGIYFQRLRQLFIERLEESTLMGRLPDLWPDMMPRLVGRILRGVTLQTGVREERDARPWYRPGPQARTWLAGGDLESRRRALDVLSTRGGWFEIAAHASATRLEFDKAMINLVSNLLGQTLAIDDSGLLRPMTVAAIRREASEARVLELVRHVLDVGKAVHVYEEDEEAARHLARLEDSAAGSGDHIPSSLQWLELNLRTGRHRAELGPTEAWLLEPLIRYARSAGLDAAAHYFEHLRESLLRKLAIAHLPRPSAALSS